MSAASFAAAITVESGEMPVVLLEAPKKSVQRSYPQASRSELDIELQPMSNANAIFDSRQLTASSRLSVDDVDNSRQTGPATEQVQTIWKPYKNRFRVLACCMTAFGNGMNDSAPGALLASIERHVFHLLDLVFSIRLKVWQRLQDSLWHCIDNLRLQRPRIYCCCFLYKRVIPKTRSCEDIDDC